MAGQAPEFLTVEETAQVLRIRRTAAYQLVNHDLESGGSDGLRARRFGRLIRVPRAAVEELTGGPIAWPPTAERVVELDEAREERPASPTSRRASRPARRQPRATDTQRSLPFTG